MTGRTTHRHGSFFPDRINQYVKAMQYAADVHDDGMYKLSFGAPAVEDPNGIIAAVTITGGVTITPSDFVGGVEPVVDAPWGRVISFQGSAAGTPIVTLTGFDYLGQRITETVTMLTGAETWSLKAYARLVKVVVATGVTGTLNLGFSDRLGLPYKTMSVVEEYEDGVRASAGTLVVPILTDPATAATGDPRGTYAPTGTLDDTAHFSILARADNWKNADGNGGYYGIAHYSA